MLKQRIISLVLCIVMAMSLFTVPSMAISDLPLEVKNESTITISQYDIALQASYNLDQTDPNAINPLTEYEQAFGELCTLPAETLLNCGYSSDEVSIMKAYLEGTVSFEAAAERASAQLTTTPLRCTKHTTTQYTCVYSWSWDKIPAGSGTAGYVLAMMGINSQSQAFQVKKAASRAMVYYYNVDGTYYGAETPETDVDANSITCYFEEYKMNDLRDSYIWAKNGNVSFSIEPAVSGGDTFSCVRAQTAYYPSTSGDVSISVGIAYNIFSISASASFGSHPSAYGVQHFLFYNDGRAEDQN